ncbi:MAG: bifunctional metallophosphatase/5'-nucleotidase [Saprospiraceae bacterium]|nr:bifunctional metallophosphatase/5'-nucleotidase [Saprospiraceae bacterium]
MRSANLTRVFLPQKEKFDLANCPTSSHYLHHMAYPDWRLTLLFFLLIACSKDEPEDEIPKVYEPSQALTIFFINDQHGQIDNFAKIKVIVDQERQKTNVILACSGDIFSGNPVVDNYSDQGFPMVDLMNRSGFDVCVLGNHEFDYGEDKLRDRINQASFEWVCANVDMGGTGIPEPPEYYTFQLDSLRVTFLGLVETNGKPNAIIPLTHPWRVRNLNFERPEQVVGKYANIKEEEEADLYIALTHLGHSGFGGALGDYQLAEQHPYFDLIIGGHSHRIIDTMINHIPIFQAGDYLHYIGKISLTIRNKEIESWQYQLIDLDDYPDQDQELAKLIETYNDMPWLDEEIGFSHRYHQRNQVGCFYTDALRGQMQVDVSFQNSGGVRSALDEGVITKREIFEISPFNNGTIVYEMTVSDIANFLRETQSGFYYSGIQIKQTGDEIEVRDLNGISLSDTTSLTIGLNDYIPAVFDDHFSGNGQIHSLNDAETVIQYLLEIDGDVDYQQCDRFFRYQ